MELSSNLVFFKLQHQFSLNCTECSTIGFAFLMRIEQCKDRKERANFECFILEMLVILMQHNVPKSMHSNLN